MRSGLAIPKQDDTFNVRVFKQVFPYLLEYRMRIGIAFLMFDFG